MQQEPSLHGQDFTHYENPSSSFRLFNIEHLLPEIPKRFLPGVILPDMQYKFKSKQNSERRLTLNRGEEF